MATTVEKYLAGCQKVVDAKPKYVNGASDLDECDCIGMDKYSFRENNVKFSSTGTNHTARAQVTGLRRIVGTSDLQVGDVVFKVHNPGESGYDLPKKYLEGGKEYNGDLRDYYHIGTVKSVYPLQIMHMTKPTAKVDTTIGKWAFTASWKPEYVAPAEPSPEPSPEPTPVPDPTPETAIVWAENGKPVNLRARPSKAAALVDRVPVNEEVTMIERAEDWCHVKWKWKVGYIMTDYLILPEEVLYTATIHHINAEDIAVLKNMFPAVEVDEERG